jgi:hypothetical protein
MYYCLIINQHLLNCIQILSLEFFTIKHYAKVIGDADERFIALKHDKTNQWVRIDSGIVTLQVCKIFEYKRNILYSIQIIMVWNLGGRRMSYEPCIVLF